MFWILVFSLSFVFLFLSLLISYSITSVFHWWFSNVLFNLYIFVFLQFFFSSWHWFIIHRILVTKYAWYDFNFLKFAMAPFVAQYVIYPGDSSICIWKECALCYFQMKCSVNINEVHRSNKLFKTCVSSLIFLSGWLVHWCKQLVEVLHYYCATVDLSFYGR